MADPPVVDVERLVDDLRERVARARAEGLYADDLTGHSLRAPAPPARVRFRPELGYSSRLIVGAPLTAVKKVLLRLLIHVFDDLAHQTDAAIGGVEATAAAAEAQAGDVRSWAEEALAAEAGARERSQVDIADLMGRIGRIEDTLERLQLPARLARLERRARQTPAAADLLGVPASTAPAAASDPGIDYLAFEARFRGTEETIRERQEVYRRHLKGRRRVVDVGCGRGELLDMMRDAGVPSYGVDTEPDFVELVAEKGLDIRREDAIAHLEALERGTVDGIVASHVIEHMLPSAVARLVGAAAAALGEGGILILETPNPESLLAGSVNFHRDPTHQRPVHPETLAFLCESAGFSSVEILRLSPVPESERLPERAPGDDPLARHVDAIAERLNGIVYGWQDYAVLARR